MTDRPEHADQPPPSQAQDSRAEQVLAQALRAMVGGDKPAHPAAGTPTDGSPTSSRSWLRLTTGQLLLLSAIVGLLIGIAAGLFSLLL